MKRLNLTLTDSVHERLRRLQEDSGAATAVEAVRRSLAVYETLLRLPDGARLYAANPDGTESEIILTF